LLLLVAFGKATSAANSTQAELEQAARYLEYRLGMMDLADAYVVYLGVEKPNGQSCREWNERDFRIQFVWTFEDEKVHDEVYTYFFQGKGKVGRKLFPLGTFRRWDESSASQ